MSESEISGEAQADLIATSLLQRAFNLCSSFPNSRSLTDIEAAINLSKEAANIISLSDSMRLTAYGILASAMRLRYQQFKLPEQLDELISVMKAALLFEYVPDQNRLAALIDLANLFKSRFEYSKDEMHWDEQLRVMREAVILARKMAYPDLPTFLTNLGDRLDIRFQRSGDRKDFDEMISLYEESVKLRPLGDPDRLIDVRRLQSMLTARFLKSNDPTDLEKASQFLSESIDLISSTDPEKPNLLHVLGSMLESLFEFSRSQNQLLEAIDIHRRALELRPSPHALRGRSLMRLANAYYSLFLSTRQRSDIDLCISSHREAYDLSPPSQASRFDLLDNLATMLNIRFDYFGDEKDLEEAITYFRDNLQMRSNSNEDISASYTNLAVSLSRRFRLSGKREDLEEALTLHEKALTLRDAPHPDRFMSLNNVAKALVSRFQHSSEKSDLERAELLLREALSLGILAPIDRAKTLNNMGSTLKARFKQTSQQDVLDEAIGRYKEALALTDAEDDLKSTLYHNLGNALCERFRLLGDSEDADEAVSTLRMSLAEISEERLRLHTEELNDLASALVARFTELKNSSDLDEAMAICNKSLSLQTPTHSSRFNSLNTLGQCLNARFGVFGDTADMDRSIIVYREALNLRPVSHLSHGVCLNNLGNALKNKFFYTTVEKYLDEAIEAFEEALDIRSIFHSDRPSTLNNLVDALVTRFQRNGKVNDLEKALSFLHEFTKLHAHHPLLPNSMHISANALTTRFFHDGDFADLNEAITLNQQALYLRPVGNPLRVDSLDNLATILTARFEVTGRLKDLDDAISFLREARSLPYGRHIDRGLPLTNLANSLMSRFSHSRQQSDLDEARVLYQEALTMYDETHHLYSRALSDLASCWHIGHKTQEDLDESIRLFRNALELQLEGHTGRSTTLNNLANAQKSRYELSGQRRDFDAAFSSYEGALQLQPPAHPERPRTLSNFADLLLFHFEVSSSLSDWENAMSMCSETLDILPSGHPGILNASMKLAKMHISLFKANVEKSSNLDKAVNYYRLAVNCEGASATKKINAAREWAFHADSNHESDLEAYRRAISLLPSIAALDLDLKARQKMLSGSDGLARNAAACAIRYGKYQEAVELYEAGRGIFWTQSLQLRTPLTELAEVSPELESKLRSISLALNQGSFRAEGLGYSKVSSGAEQNTREMMEREAAHYRRLSEEWASTINDIRKLDRFEDFMRPRKISSLLLAAKNGPVVILNASLSRTDALILLGDDVEFVSLPDISFSKAQELVELTKSTLSAGGRYSGSLSPNMVLQATVESQDSDIRDFESLRKGRFALKQRMDSDETFRYVLGILWDTVVYPILRRLEIMKSKKPRRLWWCPSGPFVFLPIHAAGHYTSVENECTFDYINSSYTPTISALLSPSASLESTTFKEMLVVIQPEALPKTTLELEKIRTHVPSKTLKVIGSVSSENGSAEKVLSSLPTASIAHFACHGRQDIYNPLESALIIGEDELKVSRIMQNPMPNASLAFLCACETAMGDINLPDEAIHLGATLLFSGFDRVIATMWAISDDDGPEVADMFYEHLFNNLQDEKIRGLKSVVVDTSRSAEALHRAVIKLRSTGVSFVRWVPFIHIGR